MRMLCGGRSSGLIVTSNNCRSRGIHVAPRSTGVGLVQQTEKRRFSGYRDYLCVRDLVAAVKTVAVRGRRAYANAVRAGVERRLVEHDRGSPDQREMLLDAGPITALPQSIV